jgi:CRP-like cAMP-binding protein
MLPGFKKFMKYYNMDDKSVGVAASLIIHKRYPKGSTIFRQGDKSDCVYGIIKGLVSIREKKIITKIVKEEFVRRSIYKIIINLDTINSTLEDEINFFKTYVPFSNIPIVKEKEVTEVIDEEKLTMGPGFFFGQWGVLDNKDRASTVYCLEDTDVFMLDAASFDLSFNVKYYIFLYRNVCQMQKQTEKCF